MSFDILVVDDEEDIRDLASGILKDEGYETRVAYDSDSALEQIERKKPGLIFLDIWLQGSHLDGMALLNQIKTMYPDLLVIMISGHGNIETAVSAIQRGAYDFLEKPFKADRFILLAKRAFEIFSLKKIISDLRMQSSEENTIVGSSPAIVDLRQTIEKISSTSSRIMIIGDSGSGKELVARVMHLSSSRKDKPFFVLNAATMTPEGMEHSLFGVEFHAGGGKIGALEAAHGGTLYIDEVTDMPKDTQKKILRVLVEQKFQRVGGGREVKVDVRIISSTARNIKKMIAEGFFREDLYHRLAVVPIYVPSLAQRREDIPILVNHFIKTISAQIGIKCRSVSPDAMLILQANHWPGNVRELRNNIERLLILLRDEPVEQEITFDFLPEEIKNVVPSKPEQFDQHIMSLPLRQAREVFEREYLLLQIHRFGKNISKTAEFIGMERSALHRKLKSLGIQDLL